MGGVNQIYFSQPLGKGSFSQRNETWRRMPHLMCNINFTSDMIAGSGFNWPRGQVHGKDLEILLGAKMSLEIL